MQESSQYPEEKPPEPISTYVENGVPVKVYPTMWAQGAVRLTINMAQLFKMAMPITIPRKK